MSTTTKQPLETETVESEISRNLEWLARLSEKDFEEQHAEALHEWREWKKRSDQEH